jgi:RNA polymerase sigma factor (sigma-70 family)
MYVQAALEGEREGVHAVVPFGTLDLGVEEMRHALKIPVIGSGRAGVQAARVLARRRPVVGAELPEVVDLRSPELAVSEAELFRQLDAALHALPFEQRSAFVLAQLQGLSYEEVARIEGVGVGTVKSRIARAREKLRCLLHRAAEPHS